MRDITVNTRSSVKKFINVKVPMRDGINLATDVLLPEGEGPFPVILYRTPYVKSLWATLIPLLGMSSYDIFKMSYVKNGYAVVAQDVRGRGDSEGVFYPFLNEAKDGYDSIEWLAAQPWCNGKVGTDGTSYAAIIAFAAATERPPHLTAISTGGGVGRFYNFYFVGGIKTLYDLYWHYLTNGRTVQGDRADYAAGKGDIIQHFSHLPLDTMDEAAGFYAPVWHDWLRDGLKTEYWGNLDWPDGIFKGLNLPALHITGWFDLCEQGTVYHYEQFLRETSCPDDQHLIIGSWPHEQLMMPQTKYCDLDFGPEAGVNLFELKVKFFDYYMKGKGDFNIPKVQLFDMNKKKWARMDSLLTPAPTPYYLDAATKANGLEGDGIICSTTPKKEGTDTIVYDPGNPTPVKLQLGIADTSNMQRDDVLIYKTEILGEEILIAGKTRVKLYISSDAPDTDFITTIYDALPDGRYLQLTFTGKKARYRNGLDKERLLQAGQIYEIELELPYLYYTFSSGHGLVVEISSCKFPYFSRNLNTGNDIATDTEMRIAHNTIHRSRRYPSQIILPVVKI